jgi:asparagine synthase (glutamine-hydrolysing)
MCGIGGYAGPEPLSQAAGDAVLGSLRHRGPDASGRRDWVSDNATWTLLHTRLSIVDLSVAGNQPMANEDESLWMVFNGEIYNSPELRQYCESKGHTFRSASDGEVILHLWEMEGWRSLRRLNGIFAVAIADALTGEVVLARDPMGVKPLFYGRGPENRLWFGSEIATVVASDCPLGGFDTIAIAQFLTFLWVPDPRTPYVNLRSLEPGHALRWTSTGLEDVVFSDPIDLGDVAQASAADLGDRLEDAVHRQLMADVPVGIMVSGGIDSSLIWHYGGDGFAKAFTIDWTDETGAEGLQEDTAAVRLLEGALRTPVSYLPGRDAEVGPLPRSGDLIADPAYELIRSIAHNASAQGYKVLFSGQGGDELLAGYRRHVAVRLLGHARFGHVARAVSRVLRRIPSESVRLEYLARLTLASASPDPLSGYLTLCSYSSSRDRASALGCMESDVSDDVVWARHREIYDQMPAAWPMLRKARMVDLCVYLPGLGLAYTDRAGMDAGVEIRVPFLDLEMVKWAAAVPGSELIRRGKGKVPARHLAEKLLGREIASRPKRGLGVPKEMLAVAPETTERGFRQSQYFTLAKDVLRRFEEAAPTRN